MNLRANWLALDNLYADDVHLTAVANAALSNAIITEMNVRFGDLSPLFMQEELAELAGLSP